MTNTSGEMTVSREDAGIDVLPRGASAEAPPMHCSTSSSDDCGTTSEEEESMEEYIAAATAAGNAAKAARRVGLRGGLRATAPEPDTDMDITATSTKNNTTRVNTDDDEDDDGYNKKKNETTTCKHTSGTGVDDDDYNFSHYNSEEEGEAYKMSSSATLSQSVHIIQQQRQQPKALIAAIGLFLVKAWNWLYNLIVTIIFLNSFYTDNGDSSKQALASDSSVGGESSVAGETTESIGSGSENTPCDSLLVNNTKETIIMSPNTCSIQNQEVEKAQQAMMAAEKVADTVDSTSTAASEAQVQKPQQHQITIIVSDSEEVESDQGGDETVGEENSDEMGVIGRRDSVDSYTSSEGSGNLGDTEDGNCDKAEENNNNAIPSADENGSGLSQKIISQVESMFSDEHLSKDGFLLKHVRRRSDGFVSLKLVAGLRKVKQISREFPVVLNALRDSTKLEINPEGTKVRRVEPLTSFLKSVPIKSKDKEKSPKDKENGSSNDENQPISAPVQPLSKSPSRSGNNKEISENGKGNQNGNNRRNSAQHANANNGGQSRRNSNAQNQQNNRKSSNASTSSNNSSRHNSFSKPPSHPADLLRNVYSATYSSSGEDTQSPQVGRRRGGSLPITALQRSSGAYLSPNSSPPNGNGAFIGPNGVRPKSNSYCEGASPTTMSPWLQRRKASASSRLSSGELIFSGVIRQPRGPDGTKGFATGYRAMILEERLNQQSNSAVSA